MGANLSREDFDNQYVWHIHSVPQVTWPYEVKSYWEEFPRSEIQSVLIERGYKDLGWMNGWVHIHLDEDHNPCTETLKPSVYTSFTKESHPSYCNCMEQKHIRTSITYGNRGAEALTICDGCRIFWRVDSSD